MTAKRKHTDAHQTLFAMQDGSHMQSLEASVLGVTNFDVGQLPSCSDDLFPFDDLAHESTSLQY